MDIGDAIGRDRAATAGRAGLLTVAFINPLRAVWWLFTNVRFAMALLAAVCVISLAGVVIPQVPPVLRGDALLEKMWVRAQEDTFGFLTSPMDAVGFFDIFHAGWFAVLMGLTVASTGAYILSRVPGVLASITRPRRRVPDGYFETAPIRVQIDEPIDAATLTRALRRSFYKAERFDEPGVTYVFADRFQWAQLGTLLTHAAVIILIFSAVVSRMDSFETGLFLPEGSTEPVFPVRNPNQLQVELTDSHARFAADGQALDYRSDLVIYQNGEEVKRCSSTVNSPCTYGGYSFFQAAWFGFGAALQVRDRATGNVVYRETLALSDRVPAPRVAIRDAAGATLMDETLVLTDELDDGEVRFRGSLVRLPGRDVLIIGLRETDSRRELVVLEPDAAAGGVALTLEKGDSTEAGGLEFTFVAEEQIPALVVDDVPLPSGARELGGGTVSLQLTGVAYGTAEVSAGDAGSETASGAAPLLTIAGLDARSIALGEGEGTTLGGYEYTFLGQREFSGIQVKKDRSDYLVWAGAGLIVLGLMLTFWVPRRRLWARISRAGSTLAGQAPGHADYAREMRRLAGNADASIPATERDE